MVLLLHGGIQCAQGKAVFESHQIIQTPRYGRIEVMVRYAPLGRVRLNRWCSVIFLTVNLGR